MQCCTWEITLACNSNNYTQDTGGRKCELVEWGGGEGRERRYSKSM